MKFENFHGKDTKQYWPIFSLYEKTTKEKYFLSLKLSIKNKLKNKKVKMVKIK